MSNSSQDQKTGDSGSEPRVFASAVLRSAKLRDEHAEIRDTEAEARDVLAHARDDLAMDNDSIESLAEVTPYARVRGQRERQRSALDRSEAGSDRRLAADDRVRAAKDRRSLLVDALTGAHGREVGLMELERQLTLAHRKSQSYVLAFVDVDGLKGVNDTQGHAAGDRRLVESVNAMRHYVRDYDVILRLGGDEFLCGLAEMDTAEAGQRFVDVNQRLAEQDSGQVTVGLATLRPDEDLDALINRADAAMYVVRGHRGRAVH